MKLRTTTAYVLAFGCWTFLFGVCTYGFWAHP